MNDGYPPGGPGQSDVKGPQALGAFSHHTGRFHDHGPVDLQALDQADGDDGHLGIQALTGRTAVGDSGPFQGILDVGGLRVGRDDGQVPGAHGLQLAADHLSQPVQGAARRTPYEPTDTS